MLMEPAAGALAAAAACAGLALGPWLASMSRRVSGSKTRYGRKAALTAGLTCAALMSLMALAVRPYPVLPAYVALAAGAVVLMQVDLSEKRLPNIVVGITTAAVVLLLAAGATVDGSWIQLGVALLGGAAWFALYLLLALTAPSGALGMGDVKLGFVLGVATAYLSWSVWFAALLGGFLLGGLISAFALVTRRATIGGTVPFGPSMLIAVFAAIAIL